MNQRRFSREVAGRKLACFAAAFSFALLLLCLFLRQPAVGLIAAAVSAVICFAVLWSFTDFGSALRIVIPALLCAMLVFRLEVAPRYRKALALDGERGSFTLEVSDEPTHGSYYTVLDGRLLGEHEGIRASVVIYHPDAAAHPGDVLNFYGRASVQNDEYFNSSAAESRFLTLRVSEDHFSVEHADKTPLRYIPLHFSLFLRETLTDRFEGDQGGLVAALLSGSKAEMSRPFRNALSLSGTSHVTAVSGMHVGLIAALMLYLLGRRYGLLAAVPVMVFFGMATGLNPPVLRALLMAIVSLGSYWFDRENDTITSIMASLLLILLVDPLAVLSVSLQLSFASVLGIVLMNEPISRTITSYLPVQWTEKQPVQNIITAVSVSLAASIGAMPVSAVYFTRLSIIAPLTNLAVLWLVPIIMGLGAVFVALALLWPFAAQILSWTLELCLRLFIVLTDGFAKLPFSTISSREMLPLAAVLLFSLFLLFGYMIRPKRRVLCVSLLSLVLTSAIAFHTIDKSGRLDVVVHDSGLTLLRCGSKTAAIVDTTSFDDYAVNDYWSTLYDWGLLEADQMILNDRQSLDVALPSAKQIAFTDEPETDSGSISISPIARSCVSISAKGRSILWACGTTQGNVLADYGVQPVDLLILDGRLAGDYVQTARLLDFVSPSRTIVCRPDEDWSFNYTYILDRLFEGRLDMIHEGESLALSYPLR